MFPAGGCVVKRSYRAGRSGSPTANAAMGGVDAPEMFTKSDMVRRQERSRLPERGPRSRFDAPPWTTASLRGNSGPSLGVALLPSVRVGGDAGWGRPLGRRVSTSAGSALAQHVHGGLLVGDQPGDE